MKVSFRIMNSSEEEKVSKLIKELYQKDPNGKEMTGEKIRKTFQQLKDHPDYGSILVFEAEGQIIGYSILINFWSNEYGGIILNIDELFIKKEFRNKGIGTSFLQYLMESQNDNWKAIRLEVLPYNRKALKLYQRNGFKIADRDFLIWEKGE